MLTFSKRILLLVLLFVGGMALTGLMAYLVAMLVSNQTAALRMTAVVQDLFAFVLPAVVTAMLVTRLPADFLQVRSAGGRCGLLVLLAMVSVVVAVPAINTLARWNDSFDFGAMQSALRAAEESAQMQSMAMLGGDTVADLVLGVLIVGVLAGFSEELFFRGTLQRLLMTRPMSPHLAIWITALVFSAMHMQFFGFIPRLLLGALFGYIAWWSHSLWPAVAAHVFNNALTVTVLWVIRRGDLPTGADAFGAFSPLWLPLSVVGLTLAIFSFVRLRKQ